MTVTATADVIVVGTGAAGMCCAITLKKGGLNPILIEKTASFGGSTAVSGGAVWIPCNPHSEGVGHSDTKEAAMTYLEAEVGNRLRRDMAEAFLDAGPEVVRFLEAETEVKFAARAVGPDYHPDQPGGTLGGRVMDPLDYDARRLGKAFKRLRGPIKEFTVLRGMMVGRADLGQLPKMLKSPSAFAYSTRIVLRHMRDLVTHGRGTRAVLGNALAARLGKTVYDLDIPIYYETALADLVKNDTGRVVAVNVSTARGQATIQAKLGVVLAGGGFPQNEAMRQEEMPHAKHAHYSMSPEGNTGDGLRIAERNGAARGVENLNPAFWAPVSRVRRSDGTVASFPHLFLDRAKPGLIAVDGDGERFVNESASYHDFVSAMIERLARGKTRFWLIADHTFLRAYGLGAVRPFPGRIAPFVRSGYLIKASSREALAEKLGIPAKAFINALERHDQGARLGEDEAFGKGASAYNRYLGDPENKPNPCLRPITGAPFYAAEVFPGDIGTSTGIMTDTQGRVLGQDGTPMAGVWAAGNDANSIMAGSYPGPGITLGPALTFGWIAAQSILAQAFSN